MHESQRSKKDGAVSYPDFGATPLPTGRFWVRIPSPTSLSAEDRKLLECDLYPFDICEHLPEHVRFLDFLIEQGVAEWKRILDQRRSDDDPGVRHDVHGVRQ